MNYLYNIRHLSFLWEDKSAYRKQASFHNLLKKIQHYLSKSKKHTVKACIVTVQDTKSTQLVSFVQPVQLLKTNNANLANISSTIIEKGLDLWSDFFKFWNFDGEHHVQSTTKISSVHSKIQMSSMHGDPEITNSSGILTKINIT